jgi:hypothetical protein
MAAFATSSRLGNSGVEGNTPAYHVPDAPDSVGAEITGKIIETPIDAQRL